MSVPLVVVLIMREGRTISVPPSPPQAITTRGVAHSKSVLIPNRGDGGIAELPGRKETG
jgi:hypothetical protein